MELLALGERISCNETLSHIDRDTHGKGHLGLSVRANHLHQVNPVHERTRIYPLRHQTCRAQYPQVMRV